MHNPLEDPVPDDPIQRVHAFAQDLAYGAIMGMWSSSFCIKTNILGKPEWSYFRGDPFEQVMDKWQGKLPSHELLVSLKYLRPAEHNTYYLTEKAFSLLPEEPTQESIFISYCHQESSPLALYLSDQLKQRGKKSFLDADIEPGDDWETRLRSEIMACETFVCLIGPTTLKSDNVRQEILWALEANARVIPIWHNGFDRTQLDEFKARFPQLDTFYGKQAILIEPENASTYKTTINQLLDRLG